MIRGVAGASFITPFLLSGCLTTTTPVRLNPQPQVGTIAGIKKIPTVAALVIDNEMRDYVFFEERGAIDRVAYHNVGSAFEASLLQAFSQLFDSVRVVSLRDSSEGAGFVLEPNLATFRLLTDVYTLKVHFAAQLSLTVFGCEETPLSQNALHQVGEYVFSSGPIVIDASSHNGLRQKAYEDGVAMGAAAIARGLVTAMVQDPALASYVAEHYPTAPPVADTAPVLLATSSRSSGTGTRLSIAVLDLRPLVVTADEATILTDRLRIEMARLGRFQVIERERMAELLQEHSFQQSGLCDTERCYLELGHLVGANAVVVGSVGKVGRTYTVTARMIDVETGEILAQAAYDCPCEVDALLTNMQRIAQGLAGTGQ